MKPEETASVAPTDRTGIPGRREDSAPPNPRRPWTTLQKRALWIVVILCVGSGLVVGAAAGYTEYKRRQVQSLTESAVSAMARQDFEDASLSARRALQLDENSLRACKVMAEIGERAGDVRAMAWRQRAVELAPGSVDELIAYASTAVRFGKTKLASEVLARIENADRNRADFQAVSGAAAIAAGNTTEAERYFAEAVRLAPDQPIYRVHLGTVQSTSRDYFTKEAGRRLLNELAEDPEMGGRAVRSMIASYEMTQEYSAALRLSRSLASREEPLFLDEITQLRLLRRTRDPLFGRALEEVQAKAEKKPELSTGLVTWLNSEGMSAEAAAWVTRAFPEVAKTPGLRAALAVSLESTRDWSAMLDLTKLGPWPEAEYGRHAYRARALREEGQIGLASTSWKNAISSAAADGDALSWLAHIAGEWNWPDEQEEALLTMVGKSPKARKALSSLSQRYLAEGNTAGLRRLATLLLEFDPSDDEAQNDYAILSLLLHTDVPRALRLAFDLHDRHPDHAGFTSTHAFALNYEGRSDEAMRVLETLSATDLEKPGIAGYYGIVLVANGEKKKAVRYLQIAQSVPLLREEALLVEKALQTTGYVRAKAE